jgi:hypothetical protein
MMKSEYNLGLLAIELKVGKCKPEYAGKINFYLNLLNEMVKLPYGKSAIGIILCTDSDRVEVKYAIGNMNQPLGVATYTVIPELPSRLERLLSTSEELKRTLDEK